MQKLHYLVLSGLLAASLGTSEALAAKTSTSKPKPKPVPQPPGQPPSTLDKVEKIVTIAKNVYDVADSVWNTAPEGADYAYYTLSFALVNYQDETTIKNTNSTTRIVRKHWLDPKTDTEKYSTEETEIESNGRQKKTLTETAFLHGWGDIPLIKFDHYYYPGLNVKEEITYSMPATQYKIMLVMEKAPLDSNYMIDSAPAIETLNYQEIPAAADYNTYRRISSSARIDNQPVKTEVFDARLASINFNQAQLIQYPKSNAVTLLGDHLLYFLAPQKGHFIVAPPPKNPVPTP